MYETTNSVTNYASPNNQASADVSPVSQKATLIQKLLAEHREMQSTLGQRLHSVLHPVGPEMAEANGSPRPPVSPLVSDLEDFAVGLQQLLSGYRDILNRLEL